MNDIFISYSRHDSNVVNELVALLEQEGYSVWIDRDGIESGDDFKRVILKAIKESTIVLFFSSEHSNVSDWTAKEIGIAVKYKKHIIPILLDGSNFNEAVEFDLINLDYVDYSKTSTRLVMRERLLKALRNKLGVGSDRNERLEAERKVKEEVEEAKLKSEKERREKERAEVERLAKDAAEKKRLDEERRYKDSCLNIVHGHIMKVPEGAINGIFSASPTKKIYFSQGNLQYQASSGIWRFAESQYSIIGKDNVKASDDYEGWIDLFGWGTGDEPTKRTTEWYGYPKFKEWGDNEISNGGNRKKLWQTLSHDEWAHILNNRFTISEMRFAKANVNGVNGVILFPDNWEAGQFEIRDANQKGADFGTNTIYDFQWGKLERAGVVFLPVAYYRYVNSVSYLGSDGHYWSSSGESSNRACFVSFCSDNLNTNDIDSRYYGRSVRLVCPVE